MSNNIKQVICVRHDLGMRRGKQIAQAAHASMAFITRRIQQNVDGERLPNQFQSSSNFVYDYMGITDVQKEWLETSFAKVTVRVNSEEELLDVYEKAKESGLEVHLVTDSGRTEFHGVPTNTCIAIGPDFSELIDPITGDLKLL